MDASHLDIPRQRRNNYDVEHTMGLELHAKEVVVKRLDNCHVVDRVLSFDQEVNCALRCRMFAGHHASTDAESAMQTNKYILVLLQNNVIHFFPEDTGISHTVPVAFPVGRVIAMHVGIIVQPLSSCAMLRSDMRGFYTLWHPLDALQAVVTPQHDPVTTELLAAVPLQSSVDPKTMDTILLTRNPLTKTLEIHRTCIEQAPCMPVELSEERTLSCNWGRSGHPTARLSLLSPAPARTPSSAYQARKLRVHSSASLDIHVPVPWKRVIYDCQPNCTTVGVLADTSHFCTFTVGIVKPGHFLMVHPTSTADHVLDVIKCSRDGQSRGVCVQVRAGELSIGLVHLASENHLVVPLCSVKCDSQDVFLRDVSDTGEVEVFFHEDAIGWQSRTLNLPDTLHATVTAQSAQHSDRLSHILSAVFMAQPAGKGLGVLTVQGTSGKPPGEVAVAAVGAASVVNAVLGTGDCSAGAPPTDDMDGLDAVSEPALFCDDRRFRSMARQLRSCRPTRTLLDKQDTTDNESAAQQPHLALWKGRRTMAVTAGRGMLTACTLMPNFVDPVRVPILTIALRTFPSGSLQLVDTSTINTSTSGITDWSEFTNGMSAALRMPLASVALRANGEAGAALVRSWIKSHRYTGSPPDLAAIASTTSTLSAGFQLALSAASVASPGVASGVVPPNPSHGGLLMGLGMLGYLSCLSTSDILELLAQTHTTTTIGVLLGLASSKRSSEDMSIGKALFLHVPAILHGFNGDLEIPSLIQSCSLIGVGLLYERTQNTSMTEFMYNQIVGGPVVEKPEDKEAYAAAAGYAIGLINLGCGSSAGTSMLIHSPYGVQELDDLLIRYFQGGPDAAILQRNKELLKEGRRSDGSIPDLGAGGRPILLKEAPQVLTMLTAPGAIVALALMHLQTNNIRIAEALKLPSSLFLLDRCRFDTIMLRTLARGLVMWNEHDEDDAESKMGSAGLTTKYREKINDLLPGSDPRQRVDVEVRILSENGRKSKLRDWCKRQVPPIVRRIMRRIYARAVQNASGGAAAALLAKIYGKTGATHDSAAFPTDDSDGSLDIIDESYVKAVYWMCVAGACASLAMRYAGTADLLIRDEILSHLHFVASMRASSQKDAFETIQCIVDAAAAAADSCAMTHAAIVSSRHAITEKSLNELIFPSFITDPQPDDLISPFSVPPACYPLSYSPDGSITRPAQDGKKKRLLSLAAAASCSPSHGIMMSASSTLILSAALVMAGTGDLAIIRLAREMRKRVERNVVYGDFMALGYALGFVGLARGRATISRSRSSIAALLATMMPVWPHGSASHMGWPQPARQLWPNAIDMRSLHVVEARTNKQLAIPVRIELQGGTDPKIIFQRTPCLLPELPYIASITFLTATYAIPSLYARNIVQFTQLGADGRCHCPIIVPANSAEILAKPASSSLLQSIKHIPHIYPPIDVEECLSLTSATHGKSIDIRSTLPNNEEAANLLRNKMSSQAYPL